MHLIALGTPFIPDWAQLRPFVAELWLIGGIVAVLLAPFFAKKSNVLCGVVALAGLGVALVSLLSVGAVSGSSPDTYFRGLLVADQASFLWKVMLLVFAMGIVLMWFSTTSATMHEGDGPEFFTLLLGATLGMCLMASTTNLLMLVMAVEMASLPSYVLAGFRKTHRLGAEASLKYVLFGAASSAIMVYGLSMLYGLYGTLQLAGTDGLAAQMAATNPSALLIVALFGLIVGIGFKISAVPFHFWCPDVFEGASMEISAFLSVASKGAALMLLTRVLMTVADAFHYTSTSQLLGSISVVLGVMGAVTATVGNTAAFVQTNIKRLLAYSSIAHAGYMLCALSLLVSHNSAITVAGVNAPVQVILLYLAVYLFMNLGAFTVAGVIYRQTGSESIRDYAGMGRRSPILALCMAVFMFSLVGLPPLAGVIAKFNLLWALIDNGGWWWVLVAIIGLNTIFSLYYYARVIKVMYLEGSEEPAFGGQPLSVALSIGCAAMLLIMFVGYDPLNTLTTRYSHLVSVSGAPEKVSEPSASAGPAAAQP